MGRNNADFQGARTTLYHVAPKQARESIESVGLIARRPRITGHAPKGVFLSMGNPNPQYGEDVYVVRRVKGRSVRNDPDSMEYYTPTSVPTSDFKRVGHVHQNANGHPEVHWHPEEQCNG
jgi:hypothetical protein